MSKKRKKNKLKRTSEMREREQSIDRINISRFFLIKFYHTFYIFQFYYIFQYRKLNRKNRELSCVCVCVMNRLGGVGIGTAIASSSLLSHTTTTTATTNNNNSTLTINKTLTSRSPIHDKHLSTEIYTDSNWSNTGYSNMEELRRLGKLCDITLIAQEEKFSAHRIVLAASIPYFNAMFMHDYLLESRQDVIVLNNVDACALEHIINYSYNGKIEITNENVQALLIAANFFHLKSIKDACCEFVKRRLCVQDALCLRSFAEHLMCHDLVVSVNRFINNNFSKISN